MVRWLCCWLETLLHHVWVVATLSPSQDTVIDRFELLNRYFASSMPTSIFLIHITPITMLICLFSFDRVIMSLSLVVRRCGHDQLINFKCLRLCYFPVSSYLLRASKWLESCSKARRTVRGWLEKLTRAVLHFGLLLKLICINFNSVRYCCYECIFLLIFLNSFSLLNSTSYWFLSNLLWLGGYWCEWWLFVF